MLNNDWELFASKNKASQASLLLLVVSGCFVD